MIRNGKISLVLFAAFVFTIAAAEDSATFVCDSICGNQKKGLSTPDVVVEYNWNSRVPVCAGKSCESGTCSELELKLPTYNGDETECPKHQTGLQEAGCECKGKKSSAGGSPWWMTTTAAVATAMVTLLLF